MFGYQQNASRRSTSGYDFEHNAKNGRVVSNLVSDGRNRCDWFAGGCPLLATKPLRHWNTSTDNRASALRHSADVRISMSIVRNDHGVGPFHAGTLVGQRERQRRRIPVGSCCRTVGNLVFGKCRSRQMAGSQTTFNFFYLLFGRRYPCDVFAVAVTVSAEYCDQDRIELRYWKLDQQEMPWTGC